MPYVNISLTRGKSREYLQGVSDAVHQALVEGLGDRRVPRPHR